MKRVLLVVLIIVCLTTGVLMFANSAFAQAVIAVAQLNGTARDTSGSVVANASVSLRNLDTNRTYTSTSDASGYYIVPNLPPGSYELDVTYTGFEPFLQPGIQLRVGQTATLDVTLTVQGRREVLEVTSQTPAIEPTRTEISNVIETQQIQGLPISGRLFTDFALLTPGVTTGRTSVGSTITEFEVTRVSFAGMRDLSNQVTVDGADNINTATGSQRATPPQEAVQEFRVVNNSFGAEYGRALGGIVNIVTKSGTNTLHGSVYDYFQNNALNARSLLQPAPQLNVLRQNQFGFTLGGPIKQDKTFYFLNYEGQRRGESPTYTPVLLNNLALINASKAALGIARENLGILKTKDNDYGFARLDHELGARNQLSVRYNIENSRNLNQLVGATLDGGGIGAPSSGHNVFLSDQSLAGTLTSQIGSNLVNTALGQYARRHYNFPGVTGEPNLDIPNELLFGHNFGVLDKIGETRIQGSDSMSWISGKHFVRFGADVNHKGFQPRVGLAYSPDRKTVIRAGFGLLNDRYALSFLFITYPQRPAILPNADLPPNRRGAESAVYELNAYPFGIPGAPTPAQFARDFLRTGAVVSTSVSAPTSVGYSYTDRHSPIPYSEQASLEINREIGRGFTIGAGYLFVAAHHLLRSTLGNLCPAQGISSGPYPCPPASAFGSPPSGYPAGKNFYSGIPRYPAGLICCNDLTGNSVYHGGTLQVNKTASKYMNLNASYTLSHTLDDGTFATLFSVPEDVFRRGLESATSNQDARHRFVTNFSLFGPSNTFL